VAVSTGLASPEHARQLFASFLAHPGHHRMFCAGLNLDPITDGTLTAPMPFGDNIHGTAYLGPMAEELFVRGAIGGGEPAWESLPEGSVLDIQVGS
jgi:hypothetical protein